MAQLTDVPGTDQLGFPVKISKIQHNLNQLISGDDSDTPATKASILNLAVYQEDFQQIDEIAKSIASITRESACRSLLICSGKEADSNNHQAWVQAHCRLNRNGQKEVCSEQISFLFNSDSTGIIRNTVFSQLDSDLPLVFWWKGELSDVFEDRLYSRIDRFVFDSEKWADPGLHIDKVLAAYQSPQSHFRIHDLAFSRLNPYRRAIANAFDLPMLKEKASGIREIKIRYRVGQRQSAIYLANWLADRLGKTLDADQSKPGQLVYQSETGKLAIELTEADDYFAVAILAGDLVVELTRCIDREFLRTRVFSAKDPSKEITEDWIPVRRKKDCELIMKVLKQGGLNKALPQIFPTMLGSLNALR